MQESKPVDDEQRRRLMLLGAGAAVVGGWACASAPVAREVAGLPRIVDDIYAFGIPDASMNERFALNGAFALIGKKNTYLMVYGASRLAVWAQQGGNAFGFVEDTEALFVSETTVWGTISTQPQGLALGAYGVVLPQVKSELQSARSTGKSSRLVFRDPPTKTEKPTISFYIKSLPTSIEGRFVNPGQPAYLGGFPLLSLSASN